MPILSRRCATVATIFTTHQSHLWSTHRKVALRQEGGSFRELKEAVLTSSTRAEKAKHLLSTALGHMLSFHAAFVTAHANMYESVVARHGLPRTKGIFSPSISRQEPTDLRYSANNEALYQ